MFCSRSIGVHLLRGAGAVALILAAFYLISTGQPLMIVAALACGAGAIVLMRGCPMCWLTGLFQTVERQRAARRDAVT